MNDEQAAKLWEAIGRYGANVAFDGNMSVPQYLLDAVAAFTEVAQPPEGIEQDAARLRTWLRGNMSFYNTNGSMTPFVTSVSKRIWFHATDDTDNTTFDAIADAAIAAGGGSSNDS